MQKWEYTVLTRYPSEAELNELGQEGWNLVVVVSGGAETTSGYKDNTTGWGAGRFLRISSGQKINFRLGHYQLKSLP
jgi:hypothetical protein